MRYVARLQSKKPIANQLPLQSVSYGNTLSSLREWVKTALATEPAGARVDVYERVEIQCVSFIKVKKEDTDVVLEEPVVPADPGGRVAPPVTQPGDAVAARVVASPSPAGPEAQ